MERIFRSRNFRLNFEAVQDLEEKIYYEIEPTVIKEFFNEIPQDILTAFEYSVLMRGGEEIFDSVNFHVDLTKNITPLYHELPKSALKILSDIPKIFDKNFLNYIVGLRINNSEITGRSFYFYSTIWKGTRFGMKGISEKNLLENYLMRFIDYFKVTNPLSKIILEKYFSSIVKLKGVSVSVSNSSCDNLKIYARINCVALNEMILFLKESSLIANEKILCELEEKFGDIALTSLRIKSSEVKGLNLYFLK